jgi:hypothetical protein
MPTDTARGAGCQNQQELAEGSPDAKWRSALEWAKIGRPSAAPHGPRRGPRWPAGLPEKTPRAAGPTGASPQPRAINADSVVPHREAPEWVPTPGAPACRTTRRSLGPDADGIHAGRGGGRPRFSTHQHWFHHVDAVRRPEARGGLAPGIPEPRWSVRTRKGGIHQGAPRPQVEARARLRRRGPFGTRRGAGLRGARKGLVARLLARYWPATGARGAPRRESWRRSQPTGAATKVCRSCSRIRIGGRRSPQPSLGVDGRAAACYIHSGASRKAV